MDKPDRSIRFISLGPSDLRIMAMVAEKNNARVFHTVAFNAGAVDHLQEVNETTTAIILKGGLVIPVAHPLMTLYDMIYRPDFRHSDTLDLTAVSGAAVKDVVIQSLAEEFGKESDKPADKSGMLISAFMRKPESNQVSKFEFYESDMVSYGPDGTTRAKSGESVKIFFNIASLKLPFKGSDHLMLDMPYDDFLKELIDSKKWGRKNVDLCALFVNNPKKYGVDPQ